MDQPRRPTKRDGGYPYKKGGGGGGRPGGGGRFGGRPGGGFRRGPRVISDSTAAEDMAEYVITVLARDANAVQITRLPQGRGRTKLSVVCDPAVTGRVIGKNGATITALRNLVRAVAGRHGRRVDIEIPPPE